MATLTMNVVRTAAPAVARANVTRRSPHAVRATGLKTAGGLPALTATPVNVKFATISASTRVSNGRRMTTTASALPLAEIAAVGPEIATIAINTFVITLIGLAVGFVLLRVESAVEGED